MKIALAQMNPIVGNIDDNIKKIQTVIARAARRKADLVVFPELCVTGYPPRDLLDQASFVERNRQAVLELAARITHPAVIVGFVDVNPGPREKGLYNAAAVLSRGK